MRILITGASGLLGLNIALESASQHEVFGQVHSNLLNTDAFTVLKTDLLKPEAVEQLIDETQPDWVIHCAALANLDACENNPELARQLNTEVPRKLAVQCRKGGARLLHVSTDAVFDGDNGGYTERDRPNPLSTYAKTKLLAEKAVAEADPDSIIARVNLFGWSLKGKRSLAEFFFNQLSQNNEMMGFSDVFFCPLLANDIAHIFLKMLRMRLSGIYHVLSSDCMSKYEFGTAIARRFGFNPNLIKPVSVMNSGLKASRSPNLTLNVNKLTAMLGESLPDISSGIDGFYNLYKQGYPKFIQDLG